MLQFERHRLGARALVTVAIGAFCFTAACADVAAAAPSPGPAGALPRAATRPLTATDPYRHYRYRLRIDGRTVTGFTTMSVLSEPVAIVSHRAGGDSSTSHKSPARTKYETITLERGVTQDPQLQQWAGSLSQEVPLGSVRKSVVLEFYNEAGQLTERFVGTSGWISHYSALPDLDKNANAVAIEHIEIEVEGWTRDK